MYAFNSLWMFIYMMHRNWFRSGKSDQFDWRLGTNGLGRTQCQSGGTTAAAVGRSDYRDAIVHSPQPCWNTTPGFGSWQPPLAARGLPYFDWLFVFLSHFFLFPCSIHSRATATAFWPHVIFFCQMGCWGCTGREEKGLKPSVPECTSLA